MLSQRKKYSSQSSFKCICSWCTSGYFIAYIYLHLKAYDLEIETVQVIEHISIEFVVGSEENQQLFAPFMFS
jgi:hypothetical protein